VGLGRAAGHGSRPGRPGSQLPSFPVQTHLARPSGGRAFFQHPPIDAPFRYAPMSRRGGKSAGADSPGYTFVQGDVEPPHTAFAIKANLVQNYRLRRSFGRRSGGYKNFFSGRAGGSVLFMMGRRTRRGVHLVHPDEQDLKYFVVLTRAWRGWMPVMCLGLTCHGCPSSTRWQTGACLRREV